MQRHPKIQGKSFSFIRAFAQSWLCTYLNSLLLGALREYVSHGLCPGVDRASCWFPFPKHIFVYSGPPSILLFAPTAPVSHSTPFLAYWQPSTSVQENKYVSATSYTHRHTYLHHICITIHLFFFFTLLPLLLAGRLPLTLPIGQNRSLSKGSGTKILADFDNHFSC
jgi:hypothetical protein